MLSIPRDRGLAAVALGALLCALVLCFNVFRFPFLWDDYELVGRAMTLRLRDLLPDYSIIFYRPLSREVYFGIVTRVLNQSPLVAHILNASVLAGVLVLLARFVDRLAGRRAALAACLVLACSASTPLMLGWISASQDLVCALFVVLAFDLLARGHPIASAAAFAGALLSKETSIAVIPALFTLAAVHPSRVRGSPLRFAIAMTCVLVAWIAVHPWTRLALSGATSAMGAEREYVGFHGSALATEALHGALITLNIPYRAGGPHWNTPLLIPGALATMVLLLLGARAPDTRTEDSRGAGLRLLILVGSLTLVGPLLLSAFLLGRWSPHYSFLPALGLSMLSAPILARMRALPAAAVLLFYLWLGIGLRGAPFAPLDPSEPNFQESATALQKVDRGFKQLHPTLPPNSNVYVSIQARQSGGLYQHLLRLQAPRVWYKEPTVWVLDPNRRRPRTGNEYLFWIAPNLDVYEVGLTDLAPRGPTREIDLGRYQKTIRGYAMGLAGSGDVNRAVFLLANLPESSPEVAVFDRRTALALLYARGKEREADTVAAKLPRFATTQALDAVVALLAEPVTGLNLDTAAMRAFGLDSTDVPSLRALMRVFAQREYKLAAVRFARRIQSLQPGDAESAAIVQRFTVAPVRPILVPIPYDVPQD